MAVNSMLHVAHLPYLTTVIRNSTTHFKICEREKMVITIQSSSQITPSASTPNGILQLSESDQIMGWTHAPTVYVFKTSHDQSFDAAVDSLKNSLAQILVPYYPFAGRLHWIGGSRLELGCCAAGAEFIEASCDGKLEDFGDFEPTAAVRELVPKVDYNRPIEELPVFLVQVTKFSCGGLTIGMAISHISTDGMGAITFINSWASIARGEKTRESILQPYHDRKALQPSKPLAPPRFEHVEYHKSPLLIGCSDPNEERKKESEVALLKVSKEQVEKLKRRANEFYPLTESQQNNGAAADELPPRPYSRYESVAGHMWVCISKARSIGAQSCQQTRARIGVDIRRRLRPALPDGFSGNATLIAVTPTSEFRELTTKPLSYAAGKIREGTWAITEEYAKSALDFLASQEDIAWIRTSYHTLGCTGAPFLGNPNLVLGSWITLPLYDADFGWGRSSYIGPATLGFDGKSFIMPGPAGDGSFIIAIRLQTRHMDDFKKFFYQDL